MEASNVTALPRRLDGAAVIVGSGPGGRAARVDTRKLSDTSDRGTSSADAAPARDLHPLPLGCTPMHFIEGGTRAVGVQGEPEVGPAQPPAGPESFGRAPTKQVETEVRRRAANRTCSERSPTETNAVRQVDDPGPVVPRGHSTRASSASKPTYFHLMYSPSRWRVTSTPGMPTGRSSLRSSLPALCEPPGCLRSSLFPRRVKSGKFAGGTTSPLRQTTTTTGAPKPPAPTRSRAHLAQRTGSRSPSTVPTTRRRPRGRPPCCPRPAGSSRDCRWWRFRPPTFRGRHDSEHDRPPPRRVPRRR